MKILRDKNGFIDVSYLVSNNNATITNMGELRNKYIVTIDNERYFFKRESHMEIIYNDLIAEELAKDFGIACSYNDLAVIKNNIGILSKDVFKASDSHFFLSDILPKDKYNNLEDIWDILVIKYKDNEIVEKLMNQFTNLFIFDVLIANPDRHPSNIEIIENKDGVNIAPLYDNTLMLTSSSMTYGIYSLGLDRDDYLKDIHLDENSNLLYRFLNISDSSYQDILKSKLWVISKENIDKVLSRVEKKINSVIDSDIKESIKEDFAKNNEYILNVLQRVENKKAGLR